MPVDNFQTVHYYFSNVLPLGEKPKTKFVSLGWFVQQIFIQHLLYSKHFGNTKNKAPPLRNLHLVDLYISAFSKNTVYMLHLCYTYYFVLISIFTKFYIFRYVTLV